jgi:hypothetical protein
LFPYEPLEEALSRQAEVFAGTLERLNHSIVEADVGNSVLLAPAGVD